MSEHVPAGPELEQPTAPQAEGEKGPREPDQQAKAERRGATGPTRPFEKTIRHTRMQPEAKQPKAVQARRPRKKGR